jgi:hypothetical protein
VKNCSSSACFSTVYPKSAPSCSLCASAVPACVCFALFFAVVLVSLWSFLFLLLFLWRCFQLPVPHGGADTLQKWRWWFVVVLVVCKRWSLILLRPEGKRGADQDLSTVCLCFLFRRLVNLVILRCSAGLFGDLQNVLI